MFESTLRQTIGEALYYGHCFLELSLPCHLSPVRRHNEWECDVFISLKFVHLTKVREWFAACSYSHVNDLQAHGRALGDGVRWSLKILKEYQSTPSLSYRCNHDKEPHRPPMSA